MCAGVCLYTQILWVLRQENHLSLEFGIHSQDIISKKKRIYYPSCCKEYGLERKHCLGDCSLSDGCTEKKEEDKGGRDTEGSAAMWMGLKGFCQLLGVLMYVSSVLGMRGSRSSEQKREKDNVTGV